MEFFFSGMFWGILLVLFGVSIIVKILFHIHIPFVRIFIALMIIYFGIRILVGGSWHHHSRCNNSFGSSTVNIMAGDREYKTVFGATTIDATQPVTGTLPERFSCQTVFGETKIMVSRDIPTIIHAEAAFGEARFPNGNSISFGNTVWKNSAANNSGVIQREIQAKVVFGSLSVLEQ